jgi:hypothetical protein
MVTDGADLVAVGVLVPALASVELPDPELPPQAASTADMTTSEPTTIHFFEMRFTFHSLGRLINAHEAIAAV